MFRAIRTALMGLVTLGVMAAAVPADAKVFKSKAVCEHVARASFIGFKLKQLTDVCIVREALVAGKDVVSVQKRDGTKFRFVKRDGLWTIKDVRGKLLPVNLRFGSGQALFSWRDTSLRHQLHVALK